MPDFIPATKKPLSAIRQITFLSPKSRNPARGFIWHCRASLQGLQPRWGSSRFRPWTIMLFFAACARFAAAQTAAPADPQALVDSLGQRLRSQEVAALADTLNWIDSPLLAEEYKTDLIPHVEEAKTTELVDLLGLAMQSPRMELRRAASFALRKIDARQKAPQLLAALRDYDHRVAYNASIGLYSLAAPDLPSRVGYVVEFEQFPSQRSAIAANWQSWWAMHRSKLTPTILDSPTSPISPEGIKALAEDAENYYYQAQRARDVSIRKFEKLLAARPGDPDNLRVEFNIGCMLLYQMSSPDRPKQFDALVTLERLENRYFRRGLDMRYLLAQNYLSALYIRLDKDEERANRMWLSLMDVPTTAMVLPDDWVKQDEKYEPRTPEQIQKIHWEKADFVRGGAINGYLSYHSDGAPLSDTTGHVRLLDELAKRRPNDALYQEEVQARREFALKRYLLRPNPQTGILEFRN